MKRQSVQGGLAVLILWSSFFCLGPALAQVPSILNYQGRVVVNGTNFNGTGQFEFALVDGGTNTSRQASATAFVAAGLVLSNLVTDGGAGYLTPPAVSYLGGGGSGATAHALIGGGVVTSVVRDLPGSGYIAAPVVVIGAPPVNMSYRTFWSNGTSSVSVPVTKGLYSTLLGDPNLANMVALPSTVFTNSDVCLRVWFDGGSGLQQLSPDQRIASVGYALMAGSVPDGSITSNKLATGAVGAAQLAGGAVTGPAIANGVVGSAQIATGAVGTAQLANGSVTGTGIALGTITAANIASGQLVKSLNGLQDAVSLAQGSNVTITASGNTLTIAASGGTTGWSLTGNAGTTPGVNFVGTTDNQPVEFRVNGGRALRLEQGLSGWSAPNVIGGSPVNFVSSGIMGATIGGGGVPSYNGYSGINSVTVNFGTVGGGFFNTVSGDWGTVCGGRNNISSGGWYGTVGGGYQNTANNSSATVGGGDQNTASGNEATVGGGDQNNASGEAATVSGGIGNTASLDEATVGGGEGNIANNYYTTVAGGYQNTASGQNASVGGGMGNIANNNGSTVGGGYTNTASGYMAAVGGGRGNIASSDEATVGGGYGNTATSVQATISGGIGNIASGVSATVGGGYGNQATNAYATIPGGVNNVAGGQYSFAAGTAAYALHSGAFVWSDSSASTTSFGANQFLVRASGGIYMYSSSGGTPVTYIQPGGTGWSSISDRNAKKNFQPVDTKTVLEKLAAIPVQKWNYKWEKETDVPNIGPMAQDFKHAFYPGRDDKGISTLEFDGVELAAIQGLYQELRDEKARNDALERRVKELESRIH